MENIILTIDYRVELKKVLLGAIGALQAKRHIVRTNIGLAYGRTM